MSFPSRRGKAPFDSAFRLGAEMARTTERTAELALASARTIGFRTAMMARAAGDPVAMADPEFVLMGREKVEAGAAAALAMADGLRPILEAWGTWASRQAQGNARAALALATCRSPIDLMRVYGDWIDESLTGAQAATGKLAEAAGRIAGAGLAPIHAAASSNARRLAREGG